MTDIKSTIEEPIVLGIVSLGCSKNLVESETILGNLAEQGFIITGEYSWADVIIVNTCGFLQSAQQEAAEIINQLCSLKYPGGKCRCLLVTGCWPQIEGQKILDRWQEVDGVIGVNDRDKIFKSIRKILADTSQPKVKAIRRTVQPVTLESQRLRLTPQHWCYLRISEGCSQRCSFCTIPKIRGKYRSKPSAQIIDEAKMMIDDGAREIILIGQETTNYGDDFGEKNGLAKLLRKLDKLPGIDWIRVMYTYPANFTDSSIRAIADLEHVVKYVDIPLQHINDKILKLMNRKNSRMETEILLEKLRKNIPEIAIRTTLITGFPGEREQEFVELEEFVRECRFEALGAFSFSPEPGTKAAKLPHQVDEVEKARRLDRIMKLQKKIAADKNRGHIGKRFEVYLEPTPARRKFIEARHSKQAPEVDSVTLVPKKDLPGKYSMPGSKLTVECNGVRGYDLLAKPIR